MAGEKLERVAHRCHAGMRGMGRDGEPALVVEYRLFVNSVLVPGVQLANRF